jgi:hypothetical protein
MMSGKDDSNDDGFSGFLSDAAIGMGAGLLVLALVAGVGFYFYNNPLWGSKEVDAQGGWQPYIDDGEPMKAQ